MYAPATSSPSPAAVAHCSRHSATETENAGSFTAAAVAFLMKTKSENVRAFEIPAHVKDPEVKSKAEQKTVWTKKPTATFKTGTDQECS